jgi:hypothetical protein
MAEVRYVATYYLFKLNIQQIVVLTLTRYWIGNGLTTKGDKTWTDKRPTAHILYH